jgi:hypothetical protein
VHHGVTQRRLVPNSDLLRNPSGAPFLEIQIPTMRIASPDAVNIMTKWRSKSKRKIGGRAKRENMAGMNDSFRKAIKQNTNVESATERPPPSKRRATCSLPGFGHPHPNPLRQKKAKYCMTPVTNTAATSRRALDFLLQNTNADKRFTPRTNKVAVLGFQLTSLCSPWFTLQQSDSLQSACPWKRPGRLWASNRSYGTLARLIQVPSPRHPPKNLSTSPISCVIR